MGEPVAVYMPLADGRSDAYRLVFAELIEGDLYRLLDEPSPDEEWLYPGAKSVFAVEQERPGMLVVVAVQDDVGTAVAPSIFERPLESSGLRVLRSVCLTLFFAAAGFIAFIWCVVRAPMPLHPADPLRCGVLVSGAVVLWWAYKAEAFDVSKRVVALLSIPPILLSASIAADLLLW